MTEQARLKSKSSEIKEKNFRLAVEYDGTHYHGWQIQPVDVTIQAEIQTVLRRLTQSNVHVSGSGRTDAGVHAMGQVAHFKATTAISPEKFHDALNKMLPDDIVIRECSYADNDFHARFSAKRKTYRYSILNSKIPVAINRHYYWHIIKTLDTASMQAAASFLVGGKDFKAFEGAGSPKKSTVRTIFDARIEKAGDVITFEVSGSGFLKFMVRNITGTLVDVGLGKITPEDFREILLSKDRSNASPTAPPQGLCLMHVGY